MKAPILVVVGTRPDAIKLLPIYQALKDAGLPAALCATDQHTSLLQQVLTTFSVTPDISLAIPRTDGSLTTLVAEILQKMRSLFITTRPSLVIVQGDTTSALAAALAAFHEHIPVAHIEAGLRTYDTANPFPEEMNRTIIGQLATYHFAPTPYNHAALLTEHIAADKIFCVGNTVIDALCLIQKQLGTGQLTVSPELEKLVTNAQDTYKKIVLITAHRRESFAGGLERIMRAVRRIAILQQDTLFIFPVHLNPAVQAAVLAANYHDQPNIICIDPLPYHELIWLLEHVSWIMTDSGGIQEEAHYLQKRMIVMRNVTERVEVVTSGMGELVGTDEDAIVAAACHIQQEEVSSQSRYVYGDGHAATRIVAILKKYHHAAQTV